MTIRDEDWLRTRTWDIRTPYGHPVETLDQLRHYLGDPPDPEWPAKLRRFLALPCAEPMPEALRREAEDRAGRKAALFGEANPAWRGGRARRAPAFQHDAATFEVAALAWKRGGERLCDEEMTAILAGERTRMSDSVIPETSITVRQAAEAILERLKAAPPSDVPLHRGMVLREAPAVGGLIEDNFAGFTAERSVADGIADRHFGSEVGVVMEVAAGTPALDIDTGAGSAWADERESIVRGPFRVTEVVQQQDKLYHVTVVPEVADTKAALFGADNPAWRGGVSKRDRPVKVGDDLELAARLLAEGRRVELDQPDQVSTLLDKLAAKVKDAKDKGEKAPNYDLCDVSVEGTNLFCAESKGIPRIDMPQLSGRPLEGSKADQLPKNEKGEVELTRQFLDHLDAKGFTRSDADVPVSHLRATQNELNGGKVAGMYGFIAGGGELPVSRIVVSRDNYILDGHHRWAAEVGHEWLDGDADDIRMPVTKVDIDIGTLLDEAKRYAADWGLPQVGVKRR